MHRVVAVTALTVRVCSACIHGAKQVADVLLRRAPNLVNNSSTDGQTALHMACTNADVGIVSALLAYGAEAYAVDKSLRTPLHTLVSSVTADRHDNVRAVCKVRYWGRE